MLNKLSGGRKWLLLASLCNVLLLGAFSFYNWKLRLAFEGGSDMINLCNHHFFQIPMMRIACTLNKFFPLFAVWLGAGLKTISLAYIFNDTFYYLFIAALCFFGLKDAKAALLVLIINLFAMKSNYFIIGQELLLTAPLIIIFFSLQQSVLNEKIKTAGALFLLLFIFWSHPVAVPTFIIAALFVHFFHAAFSKKEIITWVVFAATNLLVRLLFISAHDIEKITYLSSANSFGIAASGIGSFLSDYTDAFPFIILMFCFLLAHAITNREKPKAFFLSLLFFVFTILLAVCIRSGLGVHQFDFPKIFFPVHFVVLYAGFSLIYKIAGNFSPLRNAALMAVIIFFAVREYRFLQHESLALKNHVLHLEKLIALCHDKAGSKFFVDEKTSVQYDPLTTRFHTETLFYSALLHPQKTIHLIRADDDLKTQLASIHPDSLFIASEWQMHIHQFNADYFKIETSSYTEVSLASP